MKMYAVIAVDVGETCDGHSTLCGVFASREEAEEYVREDMTDVISAGTADTDVDWVRHEVWEPGCRGSDGCVWDIHEL